jgi:hypothetical protein
MQPFHDSTLGEIVLAFFKTIAAARELAVTRAHASNFHKKIRVQRGGQEKSKRINSERTTGVNAIHCGRRIG